MRVRGIPPVMPITRFVEAQKRQLFTFRAGINYQIIRTHINTGRTIRHVYRGIDPTLIKGEADTTCIQGKLNPTCIQGERSLIYTERAKLGFKRNDN